MDAVLGRLDHYRVTDPPRPEVGLFTNTELQALYGDLIAHGLSTLEAALGVGALIEEVDILDLQAALDNSQHIDVQTVYQNLLEGSKHHLRSFVTLAGVLGGDLPTRRLGCGYLRT